MIPDVSNKSAKDASNELTDKGFEVITEYKYVSSSTIEEGKVVKTSPEIGTKRKSGTKITLYLSSGEGKYIVEDFTNENYLVAKGKIEAQCECNVVIETEKVEEGKDVKEDIVLKTVPGAGEASKLGDQIKIIIPEVEYKYPDFTKGYTIDKIEDFAKKHELKLEYKYQETTSVPEGTILKQNRAADSIVAPGVTLVITIAQSPEPTEEDTTQEGEITEDNGMD